MDGLPMPYIFHNGHALLQCCLLLVTQISGFAAKGNPSRDKVSKPTFYLYIMTSHRVCRQQRHEIESLVTPQMVSKIFWQVKGGSVVCRSYVTEFKRIVRRIVSRMHALHPNNKRKGSFVFCVILPCAISNSLLAAPKMPPNFGLPSLHTSQTPVPQECL
jgi:hypothetical protein